MTERAEDKVETLPNLDDLLQCPVCYEIPSGQIFQCNEGHHVCGRCKMRLDLCPVCRAFFFGTRNYAMEELISNVKKLRAFKLGGKITTNTVPAEVTEAVESSSEEETTNENADENDDAASRVSARPPAACSGLFRCLSCKNNPERLPLGRLLNHLRYYHSPDLIEGRSEDGGYLQAWQFPTAPGRMVTAVRVHNMGIFFLVIEISHEAVYAWLAMAAAPWVAHDFTYTLTLSGNDREAIFTDCVWSVRSCEGSLKKRGRCLTVSGADRCALLTSAVMSGKLAVRRTPAGAEPRLAEPRVVLRVANRSHAPSADVPQDLEPFLLGLQNDVARLSHAFASLGREANALVRSEAEMRARLVNVPEDRASTAEVAVSPSPVERVVSPSPTVPQPVSDPGSGRMSRNARRRMRHRLRDLFREVLVVEPNTGSAERQSVAVTPTPLVAATPRNPPPTAAPRRPVPPAAATTRSAPAHPPRSFDQNAINLTRSNTIQTSNAPNQPIRPNSNQNANRPQNNTVNGNNGARISNSGNIATSDGATRPTGPSQNLVPARANNSNQNSSFGGRAANGHTPVVHTMNNMRVVSPEEDQASSIFGGPSRGHGNSRNKKKHRQRR